MPFSFWLASNSQQKSLILYVFSPHVFPSSAFPSHFSLHFIYSTLPPLTFPAFPSGHFSSFLSSHLPTFPLNHTVTLSPFHPHFTSDHSPLFLFSPRPSPHSSFFPFFHFSRPLLQWTKRREIWCGAPLEFCSGCGSSFSTPLLSSPPPPLHHPHHHYYHRFKCMSFLTSSPFHSPFLVITIVWIMHCKETLVVVMLLAVKAHTAGDVKRAEKGKKQRRGEGKGESKGRVKVKGGLWACKRGEKKKV